MAKTPLPVVLCFSGHDPAGGAGIQADIEAIAAQGAHAATLITAHTVQDSHNVSRVVAADPQLLREQLDALRADLGIAALKVGLLADASQAALIATLARELAVPLVVDPVLRAGGGADLVDAALVEGITSKLVPAATLLTPNAAEARRLTGLAGTDACGAALLSMGCANVLITGGDEPGETVINRWYGKKDARPLARSFAWPRVAGGFHGAGCTLASAIAALLALGVPLEQALIDAQTYVHRCLGAAHKPGHGRQFPRRIP